MKKNKRKRENDPEFVLERHVGSIISFRNILNNRSVGDFHFDHLISEEVFKDRFQPSNKKGIDSKDIFEWRDGKIFCTICCAYSTLTGQRGCYSKGGAMPKDVSHMLDHLSSEDHIVCEKKLSEQFNVCFFKN
jgi:hypothetical protein